MKEIKLLEEDSSTVLRKQDRLKARAQVMDEDSRYREPRIGEEL